MLFNCIKCNGRGEILNPYKSICGNCDGVGKFYRFEQSICNHQFILTKKYGTYSQLKCKLCNMVKHIDSGD